jgi:DNA-binding winged helix-turn-helix (wHTH) protein
MKVKPLPVTFHKTKVSQVMAALTAGDSCAIVGIGSVGKSRFLRFLQREDVRQNYLAEETPHYLFVYVDIHKILKSSVWGLLELMLHQLLMELENRGVDEASHQMIDDLHQRTTTPETQHLALRYVDRAIRIVCNDLGWHLVFLIDEFDNLCRTMKPRGFSALRALRDEYKYQLSYVVATRLEWKRLRDDVSEIESFEEVISPHTVWLGPYPEDDAHIMLHRLNERQKESLDKKIGEKLLQATGGHPGLLREAYYVIYQGNDISTLADNLRMQDECQRIWLSLSPIEQTVLSTLVDDKVAVSQSSEAITQLQHKGLVGGPWATNDQIFSSIFEKYIKQKGTDAKSRVFVDHQRRTVWVNGYQIRGFPPLEYKLIAYLEQKHGELCTRDELAQHLYPDETALGGAGVSDNRLDSIVKRLRKRIEPNPKEPKYILTVRGHGFRLVDDNVDM